VVFGPYDSYPTNFAQVCATIVQEILLVQYSARRPCLTTEESPTKERRKRKSERESRVPEPLWRSCSAGPALVREKREKRRAAGSSLLPSRNRLGGVGGGDGVSIPATLTNDLLFYPPTQCLF